jgi:hypothetical protein
MEDWKEWQNIFVLLFLIVVICRLFETFPVGVPAAVSYVLMSRGRLFLWGGGGSVELRVHRRKCRHCH